MSDIVEKLQELLAGMTAASDCGEIGSFSDDPWEDTLTEAADEIQRLRDKVDRMCRCVLKIDTEMVSMVPDFDVCVGFVNNVQDILREYVSQQRRQPE